MKELTDLFFDGLYTQFDSVPLPIFLYLSEILNTLLRHSTFVHFKSVIADCPTHLREYEQHRMQVNSLDFTWRGFRFFMVWIVSTRSENSVIDERRWMACVNITWKGILSPYLEPVEKLPDWSKMVMDPSWEFHVLYPSID